MYRYISRLSRRVLFFYLHALLTFSEAGGDTHTHILYCTYTGKHAQTHTQVHMAVAICEGYSCRGMTVFIQG